MISYRQKLMTAIILLLSLATATFGQQQTQPAPATQTPVSRGPDYVENTGFKGKVFDVKYRDPNYLVQALRPLGSGFKGATMQYSSEFRTITVRDFPENIAAIEEALKRLDTPQPPQPDIELRMHVLLASNVEGVSSQIPADLSDVVKQLQSTLSYKSYSTLATVLQRVKNGSQGIHGRGTAEVAAQLVQAERAQAASYEYQIQSITIAPDSSGGTLAQLERISFSIGGNAIVGQANIQTSLSVRSGEKIVVGTATLGNKGLILVLSARVIK